MRSAVEHREHVLGADRLAPGERAARMVEPEHHPVVDVLAACRRPRSTAKHASLTSWQTIRPSTSPGASPDPRACAAERGEERLGALGGHAPPSRGPRVSSTSARAVERRQDVEADRAAAARRARAASRRRTAARPARPAAAGPSGSAPQSSSSHGTSPAASSWLARVEARARGQRAQLRGDVRAHRPRRRAGPRRRRAPAARGPRAVLARVLVPAAPALAARGARRPPSAR